MQGLSINNIVKTIPLLLLLLIIPLLKSNLVLDQGLLIRFIGLQLVILLIVVILIFSKNKIPLLFRSTLLITNFIFVLYTGLHLLWGNVYSDAIFDWLKTVSYFLLLFFIIQLYSFKELKYSIPLFISILGIILSILGLIELFELIQLGQLSIPLSTYQITTVFGHRNLYAQVLFLSLPFQVFTILQVNKSYLKIIFSLFVSITIFILIILSNRAVWFALITGLIVVIIINLWYKKKEIATLILSGINFRLLAISLTTTLLLSGLFFAYFTQKSEAKNHFSNIIKTDNGSVKDRLELWERSLKLIKEKPLLGYGGANWKIEMLKYGSKGLVSENNITFYQRPHNDFLWIFSEFGIIGGILYLLAFLIAFVLLASQIKKEVSIQNNLFQYAILYSLTGITVFSLLSFPHERIVLNIILFSFFAVIITYHFKDKRDSKIAKSCFLKILTYSITIIIVMISILYGYKRFVSEAHTKNALLARSEKRNKLVINQIDKATTPFYQMDPLSTPISWYKGMAWYQLGQPDSAMKYLLKAYQLNPYHVHVLNNLASAHMQKGETIKAIKIYEETIKIYPKFEEALLNLCAVYYNINKVDSAFAILTQIDIDSQNPKYKPFLKAVLKTKFTEILKTRKKKHLVKNLPDNNEWYYQQYKFLRNQNIPINNLNFESNLYD